MTSTPSRYCEEDSCGRKLDETRSDAKFCSNACRQRAYRRRAAILRQHGGSWENVLDDILSQGERYGSADG